MPDIFRDFKTTFEGDIDRIRRVIAYFRTPVGYDNFYHATRTEHLPSVRRIGLVVPDTATGLGGERRRPGIYLGRDLEVIDVVMDDYEVRPERVAGDFALLRVMLPRDWPLEVDRETHLEWRFGRAVISYRPIPPDLIEVLSERHYHISKPPRVRFLPGEYAREGSRVRVISTGREGVVTGFGEVSPERTIWKVRLDGETQSILINAKDIVELVP